MQKPAMTKVTSSQISSIGYDKPTKTLFVEFTNGDNWKYPGVPASTHSNMMAVASVGSFFSKHIKNQFAGTKL